VQIVQFAMWSGPGFGALEEDATDRVAVPASLFTMLRSSTVMAGMFLGVVSLGIRGR
jgi:hypothetical protein